LRLLNFDRVLCISPHPDDVEIGMLGTILRCDETVFDIFCLTICGAKGFDDSYKLNRIGEIENLWRKSFCKNVNFIKSECSYFEDKTEPGWINYIENSLMNTIDYDCIFIVPYKDSMFEHRFVNEFGQALIRHKPISLVEYNTVSTLNSWIPNMYVDITKVYYKKVELLKEFESQLGKRYFSNEATLANNTNFQCCKKGMDKVEKYRIIEEYIID